MPWELADVIAPDLLKAGLEAYDPLEDARLKMAQGSAHARIAALEQSLYMRNQLLRDSDWAGMAHSVEIRLPLVDRIVNERLACEVGQNGGRRNPKEILAAAARPPLPEKVIRRPKTGFRLPMKQWINARLPGGVPDSSWAQEWARFCAAQFLDPQNSQQSGSAIPAG